MSTRTNILIEHDKTRVFLYRHHDGYLEGAGRDLVDRLKRAGTFLADSRLLEDLLSARYDTNGEVWVYEGNTPKDRPIYEITNDWHGDIEHAYRVRFSDETPAIQVGHLALGFGYDRPDLDRVEIPLGSLEDLEAKILAEERVMEARKRATRSYR